MAPDESDPFKRLLEEDVSRLIDELYKNLPDSIHALCFAMNIRDYLKKTPGIDAGIYAPHGNFTDTTFLLVIKIHEESMATYYSHTDEGCSRLRDALCATNVLHNGDTVSCIVTAIHDRVHRQIGTDWYPYQLAKLTSCNLFSLTHEQASKFNPKCPEDVEIRSLKEEDADLINSVWPHRSDTSIHVISHAIRSSPCVGLYSKQSNKLLSWVLKWFYGGVGVLQTVEEAKRKGYAQIVMKGLIDHLVQENWPIHATVLVGNQESTPLFEKMGFVQQFLCHYLVYICKSSVLSS